MSVPLDAQSFRPSEWGVGQTRSSLAETGAWPAIPEAVSYPAHAVESGPLYSHVGYYLDPVGLRQVVSGFTTGT